MRKSVCPNLKQVPLSIILHALSDPARLKIVKMLLDQAEACCSEFNVKVAKSTMSHHFKVLRSAGLLERREVGTRQFQCLRKREIEARCPGLLDAIAKSANPL